MKTRAFQALNLKQYSEKNEIVDCGMVDADPIGEQYVLRMLIKRPFEDWAIPFDVRWTLPIIGAASFMQESMEIRHPFVYLTIRSGKVISETDDAWHVDGFSMNITHLPEQNYIWTDVQPTEYIEAGIKIPDSFSPFKHNIHWFFQDWVKKNNPKIKTCPPKHVVGIDPYIIHRRPPITTGTIRTFVRISFTPIEIADVNNTENHLLPTNYTRDGVKSFREGLRRF